MFEAGLKPYVNITGFWVFRVRLKPIFFFHATVLPLTLHGFDISDMSSFYNRKNQKKKKKKKRSKLELGFVGKLWAKIALGQHIEISRNIYIYVYFKLAINDSYLPHESSSIAKVMVDRIGMDIFFRRGVFSRKQLYRRCSFLV